MKDTFNYSIDTFSSGGGFYHATLNNEKDHLQYVVSTEDMTVLSAYYLDECGNAEWTDENMCFSQEIYSLSYVYKKTYTALASALFEYLDSIGYERYITNRQMAKILEDIL